MGYTIVNNVTATVATQSNSGSASLVVGTGLGASFATATTASPIRCGVFDSTGALKFFFDVTGRATDTLTIANRGAESTVDANILTTDVIAAVVTTGILATLPLGLGVYGDGSDGTVTFDGTTTILGLVPASNVYTLTRDLWLAAGTVNSGVTLKTSGYRVFCQGTLTNNGTIQWNGTNASGSTAGGSTTSTTSPLHFQSIFGQAGAAGGSTAGVAGTNNTVNYCYGGAGGAGGSSGGNGGGAGGTVNGPTAKAGYPRVGSMPGRTTMGDEPNGRGIAGGGGGGAGGGDGTGGSNLSGGGGGGGGTVVVVARSFAGTGAVQARGGAGGNSGGGNSAGGGGGGGGCVIVVSSSVSAGAISGQAVDANGGTHGSKTGTGNNGSDGSNGTVILIPN